ncbi:hypothetical protein DFH06DRAFT_1129361 [Mycena polygramma]|nr:hypothetical protein DFH06DRAFT_1129361 [Mycena polygramma]
MTSIHRSVGTDSDVSTDSAARSAIHGGSRRSAPGLNLVSRQRVCMGNDPKVAPKPSLLVSPCIGVRNIQGPRAQHGATAQAASKPWIQGDAGPLKLSLCQLELEVVLNFFWNVAYSDSGPTEMQESSGQYITAFTTWIDGCGNATLNWKFWSYREIPVPICPI